MEYKALALKYRPQCFDDVVGQEHVVTALRNAILKQRVHHAYLFSGPRGIGKTSLARIFAKALNCEKGPAVKPCGQCASCVEITRASSLDIIEIDGASNRGIDEARTLIENVKLSPARSRYKIYIIDEVHMLTAEAFNALLKTLEEPPSHVKFIFATTHPHKVLPTILSRCQKFQFNLVSQEMIAAKLKKIAEGESAKVEESLLYALARAASGSIRDAESLLDQLLPIIMEKRPLDDIFSFLGIIGEETLDSAVNLIVRNDLAQFLALIDRLSRDGKDLGIFLSSLLEHLRNLLLCRVSPATFKEAVEVSPRSKETLGQISSGITTGRILQAIDLLLEAKEHCAKLNTARIPLELAAIKFLYDKNKDVLPASRAGSAPAAPGEAAQPGKAAVLAPAAEEKLHTDEQLSDEIDALVPDEDDAAGVDESLSPRRNGKSEDAAAADDDLLSGQAKAKWPELIAHIQKVRAAIASHLSFSLPVSSRGSLVRVAFYKNDYFHKEIVESAKNLKFIETAASHILNKTVGIKFILVDTPLSVSVASLDAGDGLDGKNRSLAAGAPSLGEDPGDAGSNEFINDLLDNFSGRLDMDGE